MRIKVWAIRTRHGFVWKPVESDEAIRPALFRTKAAAVKFRNSLGYFYSQSEIVRAVVKIDLL